MQTYTNLPKSITLKDGTVLKPVIGGKLNQQPFLTEAGSGVNLNDPHWATKLMQQSSDPTGKEHQCIIQEAKHQGRKYRQVAVLARNLRGKLDLYQKPYRATEWVFVEVRPAD